MYFNNFCSMCPLFLKQFTEIFQRKKLNFQFLNICNFITTLFLQSQLHLRLTVGTKSKKVIKYIQVKVND